MKLVVVAVVFLLGVGTLLFISVLEGSIAVHQVHAIASGEITEECRVEGGKIASIESRADPVKFTVTPEKDPGVTLLVVSDRFPPDNFREDIPVSIRGRYDRSRGAFVATEITTACPSKYDGKKEGAKSEGGAYGEPSAAPVTVPPTPAQTN